MKTTINHAHEFSKELTLAFSQWKVCAKGNLIAIAGVNWLLAIRRADTVIRSTTVRFATLTSWNRYIFISFEANQVSLTCHIKKTRNENENVAGAGRNLGLVNTYNRNPNRNHLRVGLKEYKCSRQ